MALNMPEDKTTRNKVPPSDQPVQPPRIAKFAAHI